MFSIEFLPGFIMGIREGLEAFLVIAIILEFLNKTDRQKDKIYVFQGLGYGLVASLGFGLLLFGISALIGNGNTNVVKLWEFGASLFALVLITTFIIFMLKNKNNIVSEIREKVSISLSKKAIILLTLVMVAREGAEVVLFIFASVEPLSYSTGAITGVLISSVLVLLIYKSLVKVNLKLIFNITITTINIPSVKCPEAITLTVAAINNRIFKNCVSSLIIILNIDFLPFSNNLFSPYLVR
jgi:high-affinity iron transporter